jgi:hypothetical protein
VLALILLLLALSFITAFIWTQFSTGPLLHVFYYFSAIWLGTMVNLLLIFSAGLLVYLFLHWTPLEVKKISWGIFLLIFTAIYTGYGLYHTGVLKTKSISLSLPQFPQAWKGKKIAQVSDVHLGIMNGEKLSLRIVSIIREEKADLVFITGDLFDGVGDDLYQSISPFNQITAPIYYVTGNHETYLGLDKALSVLARTKIRVLRDEIVDHQGVQVIGIDYPQRGWKKDIRPVLERIDRTKPAILLYHEPAQIETAKEFNIALQLSGHTHNGQMWPMKFFTHLVYKGFDYGLHQIGGYTLYTTSGAGTWGPPLRIGSTAEVVIFTIQ